MSKNSLVLLRALLRSTSQINIYRHCTDKKKKGRVVGGFIGTTLLYLILMAYCVAMSIGSGMFGMAALIPETCAITISLLSFFFTLFKTNGYLFNFKEYDMLMSLPFEPKSVAGCKFLYMYIKSLPWHVTISIAMLIGYAYYVRPSFAVYPIWLVLSLLIPVIPMLLASFFGYLIARVSAGFRKTNIIQTILILAFTLFCIAMRFVIEGLIKNGEAEDLMLSVNGKISDICRIYLPARWFAGAVKDIRITDILLFIGVSVVLFEVLFILVGRSYRVINSKFKSHAAAKDFKMTAQKKRGVISSIAFKEFKRMTSSPNYMVNAGLGEILCLILGVAALFVNFEKIIGAITQGAPITNEMLYPAIPLIVYFLIGMVSTTTISPSIEGKNYWIVQSLPISKKTLYLGKMLFNMYLTVPCMTFATVCICFSARAPFLTALLSVVLGVCLCAFSTVWGCVCGVKHMRLDWENEIEVIKQGSAVAIYMFPNMLADMALIVLTVILGMKIGTDLVLVILIVAVALLTMLCYRIMCRLWSESRKN